MPIFRRPLFTILSALSLLLCLATVVLWVRSYWINDEVQINGLSWYSDRGFIGVDNTSWILATLDAEYRDLAAQFEYLQNRRMAEHFGAEVSSPPPLSSRRRDPRDMQAYHRSIRHVVIVAPTLLVPILWFIQAVRQRRLANLGLCPTCGYDLRATPERCPECGTAV